MKKVYCKDCKFFNNYNYQALCVMSTKNKNYIFGGQCYSEQLVIEKNKNGNCRDYQKKRYKFWIKD